MVKTGPGGPAQPFRSAKLADDKSSGGWGSGFIVLAFAAVSALYVAHQKPPLVSMRPTDTAYQVHELKGVGQDIDARLWQDPFAAVERDIDDKRGQVPRDGRHTTLNFRRQAKQTLVLSVALSGAPFPEIAETRRRLRYAVLSALHVAGYEPGDEKHIGYWQPDDVTPKGAPLQNQVATTGELSLPTRAGELGGRFGGPGLGFQPAADAVREADSMRQITAPLPAFVPWEEFDRGPDDRVVVLWLDEDVLTAGRADLQPARFAQPLGGIDDRQ